MESEIAAADSEFSSQERLEEASGDGEEGDFAARRCERIGGALGNVPPAPGWSHRWERGNLGGVGLDVKVMVGEKNGAGRPEPRNPKLIWEAGSESQACARAGLNPGAQTGPG